VTFPNCIRLSKSTKRPVVRPPPYPKASVP